MTGRMGAGFIALLSEAHQTLYVCDTLPKSRTNSENFGRDQARTFESLSHWRRGRLGPAPPPRPGAIAATVEMLAGQWVTLTDSGTAYSVRLARGQHVHAVV
jgi:hypothetical protein